MSAKAQAGLLALFGLASIWAGTYLLVGVGGVLILTGILSMLLATAFAHSETEK